MTYDPRETLHEGVARLRRRWQAVAFARYSLQSLFWLALAGALLLLARWWFLPAIDPWAVAALVLGGSVLAGLVLTVVRQPSQVALAKAYDDAAGLSDRMSSAIELLAQRRSGEMVEGLVGEAARAAVTLDARGVWRYEVPREGWLAPVPVLLGLLVLVLPGLMSMEPPPNPAVEETISARLEQLEQLLSRERAKPPTADREKLIEELEKLKGELDKRKQDKKDALTELAKMMEKLDRAEEEKRQELQKLLETLRKGDRSDPIAQDIQKGAYDEANDKLKELLEELEKKLEELKKQGADPAEIEALEKKIAELRELRAKLAKLLNLSMDLMSLGELTDFMGDFEGELGDLSDMLANLAKLEKLKPCPDCGKPGGL